MATWSRYYRVLSVAVILAFAILDGFSSQSSAAGPINLDNFNKIHDGMNRKEVESILGKGTVQDNGIVERIKGSALGADLIVTRGDSVSPLSATMPEKVAHDIESLPGVDHTCAGLVDFVTVDELGSEPIGIQGWPVGNYMFGQIKITSGENLGKKHRGEKAAIIGEALARLKSIKVGSTLTLASMEFHVVGVFKSEEDLENGMIIVLLDDARRMLGPASRITGCSVVLKDKSPEGVEAAKKLIETEIAAKNNLVGKIRAKSPDQFAYKVNKLALVWQDGNRVIFVAFASDRVIVKAQVGLK